MKTKFKLMAALMLFAAITFNACSAPASSDVANLTNSIINRTVTFDSQSATVAANPSSKTITSPATTVGTLPTAPTKSGFNFAGWYTGTNGSGSAFTSNTIVLTNITVFAYWSSNPVYTVTYNSDGGSDVGSQFVTSPATTVVTLPAVPTKSGYTFGGWYTGTNGTGTVFTATTAVTANITVYAKWESGTIPTVAENYSKIATAYANGYASATLVTSDTSNSYHPIVTMHNADNSVIIISASFMDCTPAMQGIQASYIFNNYTDANGVILNGTLTYYTIGANATVFAIQGTITATGSATGAYVYKVKSDGGTLSGYAGITGYFYDYSSGLATATEPSFSLPTMPTIYYCGQIAPDAPVAATVTVGDTQLSLSWSPVSGATSYEVWFNTTNNSATASKFGADVSITSAVITSLLNGTTYYVWLKAKSSFGTSGFGLVASGTPVAPTYTVTYNVGIGNTAGSVPSDTTKYLQGQSVTVYSNTGNLIGSIFQDGIKQRFTGWNTVADGSGISYLPSAKFNMGTANVILFAQYTSDSGVLGKIGPAGGWVFYDKGSYSGSPVWRYMEVGPCLTYYIWGSINSITGATGTAVGTGQSNTSTLVASLSSSGYAAKTCDNYNNGTYSDWFLPAKDEVNAMYVNLKLSGIVGFQEGDFIWTSSEIDSTHVWMQRFDTGEQWQNFKYHTAAYGRTYPVRVF